MAEITLKATIENVSAATAFVEAALEEAGCPIKALMQINVAIDELFANIARYAYGPEGGDATVRFEMDEADRTARITLTDRGVPFNPMEVATPDTTLAAEDRKIGGLGIFLVRKTMDGMSYEYKDGCNVLTIWKKI